MHANSLLPYFLITAQAAEQHWQVHQLTIQPAVVWTQDRPDLPFTDLSWADHGCRAYEVLLPTTLNCTV